MFCTVQRECGPEGWLQGNKVKKDDDIYTVLYDILYMFSVQQLQLDKYACPANTGINPGNNWGIYVQYKNFIPTSSY